MRGKFYEKPEKIPAKIKYQRKIFKFKFYLRKSCEIIQRLIKTKKKLKIKIKEEWDKKRNGDFILSTNFMIMG
mgnify:CR=1 FL=1